MLAKLVIDGGHVKSLQDVYDLVAQLPDIPAWFGRNLDALDELGSFIKCPLEITVRHPKALERNLGRKDFVVLIDVFENLRDMEDEFEPAFPVSLVIEQS